MTKINPALKDWLPRLLGIVVAVVALTVLGLDMNWGIILFAVILVGVLFVKEKRTK
ncbi:MAG: hypothetical protein ABF969_03615 [Sporolactobacillus sp.]